VQAGLHQEQAEPVLKARPTRAASGREAVATAGLAELGKARVNEHLLV
jgi:hypothetical protein